MVEIMFKNKFNQRDNQIIFKLSGLDLDKRCFS